MHAEIYSENVWVPAQTLLLLTTKMTIASKLGHCSVIRTMQRINLLLYKMYQLVEDGDHCGVETNNFGSWGPKALVGIPGRTGEFFIMQETTQTNRMHLFGISRRTSGNVLIPAFGMLCSSASSFVEYLICVTPMNLLLQPGKHKR
jgi:hypothetical protein